MNITIKEQIICYLIENSVKSISKTELQNKLKVKPYEKNIFNSSVIELQKEKVIYISKKKKLKLFKDINVIVGKFYCNPKGFGFVIKFGQENKELFIAQDKIKDALHEDRVIARILKKEEQFKKAEGEILSVLSREIKSVTGTFMANEGFGFVIPDNQRINKDIYVPKKLCNGANSYDKVVCLITKYPEGGRNPEGEITEVLGIKGEKGVDVLSIIKDHSIKHEFNPKAIKQAEKLSEKIEQSEMNKRVDLRNQIIFTIDGEDSKDLDDAVSLEQLSNGNYKLGVHISDVSHYVREDSKIDKEAQERGTSIYLIDTVIPMLPKQLSNNLCSLNPNAIKLTLSVDMEIDKNGSVLKHKIYESVISSKAKLNYTEVSNFLEKDDETFKLKYPELLSSLKNMEVLTHILKRKRADRGAIDFNFPEAKIKLNEEGEVISIDKYERRIANRLIEEFMLICNETVAENLFKEQIPFIFRVHENPKEEKLRDFNKFIEFYGYSLGEIEDVTPKQLQSLLEESKGKKEEKAINLMMLRSLQQARYYPLSKGHFGLSCKFYCHFTSPIRRYPDLQIHRIIKEFIKGQITLERKQELEKIVDIISKSSSRKERIAEKAEDELYLIRKVEFMSTKLGQAFEGVITGVNNSAITITLDNTVEGSMRIAKIKDDVYEADRDRYAFIGKNTGRLISIGDRIKVLVEKVNLDSREILFEFISLEG